MRSGSRSRSPARFEETKSKKIYISGLPQDVNNQDVKKLFEEFGQITDVYVKNKEGFSFAFVQYNSINQAEKAIRAMNRQDFKGKEMRVNFSKPRAPKNEGGGGGGNGGFDRQRNGSKDRDFNGNNNRDRSRSRDNDFQNRGNGGGGRGGGRGGGNGGGDRPKGCFNCGDNGHFSRQCPEPKKPRDFNNGEKRDFNGGGNRNFGQGQRGGNDRFGGNRNGGGNDFRNRSPVDRGSPPRNNKPAQDMDY